MLTAIIRYFW